MHESNFTSQFPMRWPSMLCRTRNIASWDIYIRIMKFYNYTSLLYSYRISQALGNNLADLTISISVLYRSLILPIPGWTITKGWSCSELPQCFGFSRYGQLLKRRHHIEKCFSMAIWKGFRTFICVTSLPSLTKIKLISSHMFIFFSPLVTKASEEV